MKKLKTKAAETYGLDANEVKMAESAMENVLEVVENAIDNVRSISPRPGGDQELKNLRVTREFVNGAIEYAFLFDCLWSEDIEQTREAAMKLIEKELQNEL